jgi:quercetin dioxygenase-like cupin family protein
MSMFQVQDLKEFSSSKFVLKIPIQTPTVRCRIYCLEPGQEVPVHRHKEAVDVFQVVEGRGELTLDDEVHLVDPGTVILIARDQAHGMANPGPARLVFTSIYFPEGPSISL